MNSSPIYIQESFSFWDVLIPVLFLIFWICFRQKAFDLYKEFIKLFKKHLLIICISVLVAFIFYLISYTLVNSNSDREMQKCHQIEDPQLQVNCIAKVFQDNR